MVGERWAIEIKLTSAPSLQDVQRLNKVADLIGADRRFVLSQTRSPAGNEYRASCNLEWVLDRIAALPSPAHAW